MRFEWTHLPESSFGPRPRLVRGLAFGAWLIFSVILLFLAIADEGADQSRWVALLFLSALALAAGSWVFAGDAIQSERNREFYLIDERGIFAVRNGKFLHANFEDLSGFEFETRASGVIVLRCYPWGCSWPVDDDIYPEVDLEIQLPATLDLAAFKTFVRAAFARMHGRPLPPRRSAGDNRLIITRVEPSDDRLILVTHDTETLELDRSDVREIEQTPNPFRPKEPVENVLLTDGRRLYLDQGAMARFRAWFCE
jgi:hypothetical protein